MGQTIYRPGFFLKSAMIIAGELPCNEIGSQMLEGLRQLAGFADARWTAHNDTTRDIAVPHFSQQRLDVFMRQLPNDKQRTGFAESVEMLHNEMMEPGVMEIPSVTSLLISTLLGK